MLGTWGSISYATYMLCNIKFLCIYASLPWRDGEQNAPRQPLSSPKKWEQLYDQENRARPGERKKGIALDAWVFDGHRNDTKLAGKYISGSGPHLNEQVIRNLSWSFWGVELVYLFGWSILRCCFQILEIREQGKYQKPRFELQGTFYPKSKGKIFVLQDHR